MRLVVFHHPSDVWRKFCVVFRNDNAGLDRANRVEDIVIVPVEIDREQIYLGGRELLQSGVDFPRIDELLHHVQTALSDSRSKILSGSGDAPLRAFDPDAAPPLKQQEQRIVLQARAGADFDEGFVAVADAAKDFVKDAIFVSLGIDTIAVLEEAAIV